MSTWAEISSLELDTRARFLFCFGGIALKNDTCLDERLSTHLFWQTLS